MPWFCIISRFSFKTSFARGPRKLTSSPPRHKYGTHHINVCPRRARARAVMSGNSPLRNRPLSFSILPRMTRMCLSFNSRIMCLRKLTFFVLASRRVISRLGIVIFSGKAGKPAPEPTSSIFPLAGICEVGIRESRKSSLTISLLLDNPVRFMWRFQSHSSSR